MNIKVGPITQELADRMKGKLRAEDEQEIWAMHHMKQEEAVQFCVDQATLGWILTIGDDPVIIFGVTKYSELSVVGIPWMLATDRIEEVKMYFLRKSLYYISIMKQGFDELVNYVDSRNTLSIDWLNWCGFEIEEATPEGKNKELFHRFHMKGVS